MPPMPLVGAEAAAAAVVAWFASAIVSAYLADRLGFAIAPFAILIPSLIAAAVVIQRLGRRAVSDRAAFTACTLLVVSVFAWLTWRARPGFLPTGTGSDLAHHLALLGYIERHWRLLHDTTLGPYLGEMIDYTPGAHLLIALAGAWLRRDALHVAHGVVALTVALKSGLVFLIARRLLPDAVPRIPFALIAVLLLWLPYVFFAGSFMEQSFLSQVISELFAVAIWWAIVAWNEEPSIDLMALFALCGAAAFLTWPIWIGPLALTLAAVVASHREMSWNRRIVQLAAALLPIAIVAAIFTATRQVYGLQMVNAVGFAVWPSARTLTWPFLILGAAGIIAASGNRRARPAAVLFAAIALQAAALAVTGRSSGAATPYLSLKMTYLAIYPMTIAAAVLIAGMCRAGLRPATMPRAAWIAAILVALLAGRSLAYAPRPPFVITEPVFLAGDWARTHIAPACVDYLVADDYTAYWLHIAVLGNPRASGRTTIDDTFEPKKAVVRWILPNGLPHAIADNFDALPRDIRTNVDVLARFGPAAVVQRRGPSDCPGK